MPCLHPGKVLLKQYLEPQQLSQNGLARAIKVPPRRINEIIHEKRGISADTAVRLAIYFGGSASYWMHLQAEYDIQRIKQNIEIQLSLIQATTPLTPPPPDPAAASPATISPTTPESRKTPQRHDIKRRIIR